MSDYDEVPMLTVSIINDEVAENIIDLDWVDEFGLMPFETQIAFIEQLIDHLEQTLEWVLEASDEADDLSDELDDEEDDADA